MRNVKYENPKYMFHFQAELEAFIATKTERAGSARAPLCAVPTNFPKTLN